MKLTGGGVVTQHKREYHVGRAFVINYHAVTLINAESIATTLTPLFPNYTCTCLAVIQRRSNNSQYVCRAPLVRVWRLLMNILRCLGLTHVESSNSY